MSYVVTIPEIVAAEFAPSIAMINSVVKVSVTITERQIELEPFYYYAGEVFSGEV